MHHIKLEALLYERYNLFLTNQYTNFQLSKVTDETWGNLLQALGKQDPTRARLDAQLQGAILENNSYTSVFDWVKGYVQAFTLPFGAPNDIIPCADLLYSNRQVKETLEQKLGKEVSSELIFFLGEKSKIYQQLFLIEQRKTPITRVEGVSKICTLIFDLLKSCFTEARVSITSIERLEEIATGRYGERFNFEREMNIM